MRTQSFVCQMMKTSWQAWPPSGIRSAAAVGLVAVFVLYCSTAPQEASERHSPHGWQNLAGELTKVVIPKQHDPLKVKPLGFLTLASCRMYSFVSSRLKSYVLNCLFRCGVFRRHLGNNGDKILQTRESSLSNIPKSSRVWDACAWNLLSVRLQLSLF